VPAPGRLYRLSRPPRLHAGRLIDPDGSAAAPVVAHLDPQHALAGGRRDLDDGACAPISGAALIALGVRVLVFLGLQRDFVRGLTAAAVNG